MLLCCIPLHCALLPLRAQVPSQPHVAGYFALWKGVWFKRKTAVRMDDDDPEAPSSGAVDELAVRKISKLQWLVREMKQERDEMWSEMASLMAMLREFEAEKVQLP